MEGGWGYKFCSQSSIAFEMAIHVVALMMHCQKSKPCLQPIMMMRFKMMKTRPTKKVVFFFTCFLALKVKPHT